MKELTAVITLAMIAIAILGAATMIEPKSVQADSKQAQADSKQADSKQADSKQADSKQTDSKQTDSKQTDSKQTDSKQTDSKQASVSAQEIKPTQVSQALMIVNPFVTGANQIKNTQTLQTAQAQTLQIQTSNPLLDEEEFDITVANIKHDDIKVSITIDGLKNSTIIPGNPPDVILPTSKVVVFKFDRHDNAGTPGVLPIKLGDEYTPCIAIASNEDKASCLRASIDSITQPQKKALDANYIPF